MLDTIALILLIAVVIILAVAVLALFDLPYSIAKKRNHPQQDAIRVACWLSIFSLGAIWPIAFIWALAVPPTIKVEKGE